MAVILGLWIVHSALSTYKSGAKVQLYIPSLGHHLRSRLQNDARIVHRGRLIGRRSGDLVNYHKKGNENRYIGCLHESLYRYLET